MKTNIILLLMLVSGSGYACDICNGFTGINPGDFKNTIGFMYRSRNLYGKYNNQTHRYENRHAGIANPESEITEQFQVYDLRGRYYFSNKTFVQTVIPLVRNRSTINGITDADVFGLGDMNLILFRQIFEREKKKVNDVYVQRAFVGAGLKLPTGMRYLHFQGQKAEPVMQGGTGSFDFLVAMQYQALLGNLGINQLSTYKINTVGSEQYRFGNSLNSSILLFYKLPVRKILTIAPTSGIFLETATNDQINKEMVANTKTTVLLYSLGLNIFTNKLNVEMHWQPSVYNSLESIQVPVRNRWVMGLQLFI